MMGKKERHYCSLQIDYDHLKLRVSELHLDASVRKRKGRWRGQVVKGVSSTCKNSSRKIRKKTGKKITIGMAETHIGERKDRSY